MNRNIEKDILDNAIAAFYKNTGLTLKIETINYIKQRGLMPDAVLRLQAPGIDRRFVTEIKARLTGANLLLAMEKLALLAGPEEEKLIITYYVNPLMAERLKKEGIAYIDVAGNAYINVPPAYVFIKGNKPIQMPHRKAPPKVFQAMGLKIIFNLLCNPDLVNAPYRDIARVADVALGTVAHVIHDLKRQGFILDMGEHGKRLTNKRQLLEKWVAIYPETLRPKMLIGRFRATDHNWWVNTPIQEYQAYWGGETAAAFMTQYLRPELTTIYIKDNPGKLLIRNKLKKDPNGNIEILKAFWDANYYWAHDNLVPPLLIYADLLATGDARNLETARMIYDQALAGLVRED